MTETLRDVLILFDHYAQQKVTLGQKHHLKVLCRGYAAAARGWRLIAEGEGDETQIMDDLRETTIELQGNQQRRRGPEKKYPSPADELVLRRYFERDVFDLSLRHFVEAAFDENILSHDYTVDVHVNRLQRFIDRG